MLPLDPLVGRRKPVPEICRLTPVPHACLHTYAILANNNKKHFLKVKSKPSHLRSETYCVKYLLALCDVTLLAFMPFLGSTFPQWLLITYKSVRVELEFFYGAVFSVVEYVMGDITDAPTAQPRDDIG